MYELFFQRFNEKVPLTAEEEAVIATYLTPKKLRKKQYILQEGDVCRHIIFVEKGALRSYSLNDKGGESILQFALEGWTISDLFSFLTSEPSTYNIDALEDSELVLLNKDAHEKLLSSMPKYETFNRLQVTNAYIALQRRMTAVISLPLAEQYSNFTDLYPEIIQRVPQHMIASYLGLTPETLSRVRKKISTQ
jgi:CRP-like cAMP-binding protein